MGAGERRHVITIQQGTVSQNETGEEILTWVDFAKRWAAVIPLSGKEPFLEEHRQATVSHQIKIPTTAGVVPKMRVLFKTRIFDIKFIQDVQERGFKIRLICEEKV